MAKAKSNSFPTSIGAAIDLLYALRQQRLDEQKKVDAIQVKEKALEDHIRGNFAELELDGAKGRTATASLKRSIQADVTDFPAYLKWIVKKGDMACVQKRVGITALREHWANGEKVPGVEQIEVVTLSLQKVSGA
jgi:hypothetical protein